MHSARDSVAPPLVQHCVVRDHGARINFNDMAFKIKFSVASQLAYCAQLRGCITCVWLCFL